MPDLKEELYQQGQECKSILLELETLFREQDWLIHEAVEKILYTLQSGIDRRLEGETPWATHMREMNLLTFVARNMAPGQLQQYQGHINKVSIFFQLTVGEPPKKPA